VDIWKRAEKDTWKKVAERHHYQVHLMNFSFIYQAHHIQLDAGTLLENIYYYNSGGELQLSM
jgi:hypothetical protein